ncbi:hypothetical protein CQ12_06110 [Bradyrhizobium jicamae]|uniref:Homing endonuclease LAGLIDADG domain-containing protein n=1 Tax=Bradyrhizobium jicamae TaxID=280332 RepID=A0A0R3LSK5_9BRAD|nr:hypothetical protein [Bradyrhizobium jicamae]KRR09982.1 hypothetical protein CQ12_06110 [Bradyrhizobium jicamae]
MLKNITSKDLHWFVGLFESFGAVQIESTNKTPTLVMEFKSAYLDRLIEICRALGYEGAPSGPRKPSGHSVQPQYLLTFRGANFAMIENVLVKHLRTSKRDIFARRRAELKALRESLGLSGGRFVIDAGVTA